MTEVTINSKKFNDADSAEIMNIIDKLEDLLIPQMAILRATVNGELPGVDLHRSSTFEEVTRAIDQFKEIKLKLGAVKNTVYEMQNTYAWRTFQNALAYFHEVEKAAQSDVPGDREIYNELKNIFPDEDGAL